MPDDVQQDKQDEAPASESGAVKLWQERIKSAKKKWEPDFKRMKSNMSFAVGIQRPGQQGIDSEQYIANITLKVLLEKMSLLYARNPKAEWQRRPRLDFQLWDGKIETLRQAAMQIQLAAMKGFPPPMPQVALMMDVINGRKRQDMVERIGKTLENVYAWQLLEQEPDFKDSMKDVVLRALICGVGYVKLAFERDFTSSLSSSDVHSKLGDLAKRMKHVTSQLDDKDWQENDPRMQEFGQLMQAMAHGVGAGELSDLSERLVFDFPDPTTIIPDVRCRNLKTFDGARWIAQEYIKPLDEVNEFFETDIPPGGDGVVIYDDGGIPQPSKDNEKKDPLNSPNICIWEVYDLRTKSHFVVSDGYKEYIQEPEAVEPMTRRFWPVFGLVFNKVIVEPGIEASPFPPSDVDLIKHPQREWNRTREELRQHRKGNRPGYAAKADKLTEDDKELLKDRDANEVIEIEGLSPGDKIEDVLQPLKPVPIQPTLYDTNALEHDILMAVGAQQADIGPVARTTATESTIAAQSKMSTNSSNVDELDDLLSSLAKSGGEILLREMSPESAQRIAGIGAVWPQDNREDFLNEVYLDTKAASQGRPNKALDVANIQVLAPLLLQAGANPAAVIEEIVRRMDDQLDVARFLPVVPPTQPGMADNAPGKPEGPQPPQPQAQRPQQQRPQRGAKQPGRGPNPGQRPVPAQPALPSRV